jgi:threonine dehydrogenase-like Zn-dependent dehydrogenase
MKTTIIIVCHEERGIRVGDELKPTKDAILHVTSTTICGSDLYLYHDKVEGIWRRGGPWNTK